MNILIIDRFDVYRFGLKSLFQDKWNSSVTYEAGNFEEMLELVYGTDFELIILDIEIAPYPFIKEFIAQATNYTKVIVLLESKEADHKIKDLSMADGVIYKSGSKEDVLNTIEFLLAT